MVDAGGVIAPAGFQQLFIPLAPRRAGKERVEVRYPTACKKAGR
jgi:hypothetical protein